MSDQLRLLALVFLASLVAIAERARAEIVINEIQYRPGSDYPEVTALEFVELHNRGSADVDLSGWSFTRGISFTFPAGATIPANGYLVVAANPSALQSAYGISGVAGPWGAASLSNRDETIALAKPAPTADGSELVDEVHYASEGDWAVRVRETTFGGWDWRTPADGGGSSIELRNPALPNDNGQNWAPSSAAAGATPGAVNSTATTDIAPIIAEVKHTPAVPRSNEPVTISCTVLDETAPNAVLFWRNATGLAPGAFQSVAMSGDGAGKYSATLGALPDLSIVEFYVEASDGTGTRTWPAATSEGQNANCQYQVNDELFDPNEIYYLLVLSGPENNAYENLAASNPGSDRQFNVTLISVAGIDRTIRYRASMRVRGNSSRGYQFKPLRISLPLDDRWNGTSDFNLNPRGSFLQFIGFRMFQEAGVRVEDAIPVRPRRNGIAYSSSTGRNADYGRWVRVEELSGDMVDNHWPLQKGGNLYKKGRPDQYWRNTGWTVPADPEGTLDGWSKQNNSGANDWSDLTNFFAVAQQITAPHFPGAPPENSANANGNPRTTPGAWDGTAFTDSEMTTLASVADLDQWALWFAVMTILQDNETNISNGQDDDYSIYFAPDGNGGRKLHLIPHDLDTVLGLGDSPLDFDARGLYDMTDDGSVFRPLLPLLGNNATAGNAAFRTKYHNAIRMLYGSVFNADTSTNPYPAFYAFIDNHLGGWVPAITLDGIKDFARQRQNLLLSLIGSAPITPPPATSVSTLVSTPGSLMISEVLASNVMVFPSGAGFPDIIELHNASDLEVDIGGMALTDDPALPAKFIFPAGTVIPARGFLLVHADDVAGAGLHAGFGLDHEGDEVRLYSGETLLDAVNFGPQAADLSISRTGAALDVWTLTAPTLGAANGIGVPLGSIGALRINELLTNPDYLLRDDFIELHNPGTIPIALGGVRITDDFINYPSRHTLPPLSFLAAQGYRVLYPRGNSASARNPSELPFKFSATTTWAAVVGANGAIIDRLDTSSLPADVSRSRVPDGGPMFASFGLPLTIPTPGSPNVAPPASVLALLNQLRVTEVLYRPSELEFVELQNGGSTSLDITGVRFTGGIEYLFGNTVLGPGAFIVVCRDPAAFIARFGNDLPLAPGNFVGTIDNAGETLTLQPPLPWDVNILRFAYSPLWYAETNSDHSLVIRDIAATRAKQWDEKESWIFSEQQYGNPGRGFPPAITSALAATAINGEPFSYAIKATQLPSSFTANGLPAGLSLDGATGEISGSTAETGLFSVVIGAVNAAGVDSETLLLTVAVSGPLAGFQWDVAGNQTAGQPFTATLRAVDSAGRTVTGFNGNATIGAQRRTPTATVVLTEIGTTTPTPDYFEIQNVGDTAADTAGWFVLTSLSSSGVNSANPTAWPLPPILQPGEIAGASDTANLAPTETPYGDNIDWPNNPPASGWVMLVDDAGVVRDFVAWGYTAAEIETIQISHNGFSLNVNGAWNGDGAPVIPADRSLFRGGNADNNNAADWLDGATPSPRGSQNAQLIVPWSNEITPLAIRPAVEITLVNGIWSGSITFLDVGDFAELYAVIEDGSVARSNTFTVEAPTANTPPLFTKGADQLVPVDAGTRSVPLWATDILPGPSSEASQLVTFIISTDKPEMFFSGPTLQPNGTLTFTPDLKASGTANVTVRAKDNGGTLNGGVDTSDPQTFTIRLISATLAEGKYQALIEPPAGVNATHANMGRGEFTISATGRFSGKVQVGGKTYSAKGGIAHSGVATFGKNSSAIRLPRKGLSPLVLDMHADLAGPNRQLIGRLFDGSTLFAEFVAHRDGYDAKLNPLPAPFLNDPKGRGNYVGGFAAQPPPNGGLNAAQFPSGDGWALLRLSPSGALTMRGQMADGSGFAFGSSLSATNEFPFYAPLYRRGGAVSGRLRFDTTANMRLGTDALVWFRPQLRSNTYPQGWPLGIALGFDGSGRDPFRVPNQLPPGAATLTLSGGNLAGVLQKALTVGSADQISVVAPDPDKTRIKVSSTGQWSGRFVHPITRRSTTLRGVVLPHREEGRGFFLGSSEAGLVEIRPQP